MEIEIQDFLDLKYHGFKNNLSATMLINEEHTLMTPESIKNNQFPTVDQNVGISLCLHLTTNQESLQPFIKSVGEQLFFVYDNFTEALPVGYILPRKLFMFLKSLQDQHALDGFRIFIGSSHSKEGFVIVEINQTCLDITLNFLHQTLANTTLQIRVEMFSFNNGLLRYNCTP